MSNLSNPTTQLVYDFVVKHINEHHYAPTLREISEACYVSKTTVKDHLYKLEKKNMIEVMDGIHRGIVLLPVKV